MRDTGPDRTPVDADTWRRVCAVMDRVHGVDLAAHPDALAAACDAEGVRVDTVQRFLGAARRSDRIPDRLDPEMLAEALRAFAAPANTPALASGDHLGPYEVVAPLGAGGMGEVYTARDTRLGRTVAIKVLPAGLAADPERRRRFEREARAISSLNHPNVCALYDIGHEPRRSATQDSDGEIDFLVMEHVQGETLAARLARGTIKVSEAIHHGAEIAEALAAAHRHGIVHRDLKPANVMLTPHGVKLLDFGVAALHVDSPAGAAAGDASLTKEGAIVGTPDYMAPEQLRGQSTDERTDIFALGAILYEMIAGRKAFDADSPAGAIAAVLDRDTRPLSAQRTDVPAALEWTVNRCLEKDPDRRWQNAADVASHLRWIDTSGPTTVRTDVPRWTRRRTLGLIASAALVIAAIAAVIFFTERSRASLPPLYRFAILPPDGTSFEDVFALSPDGRRLAFTTIDARGARALWVQPLDALTAQRIDAGDGARYPFWSPDARFIAFFASNKLKRVELATGNVQIICDSGQGGGGSWNADGVIVFGWHAVSSPGELHRVSAAGGPATAITHIKSTGLHVWPHFLPDGKHYLYMRIELGQPSGVFAGQLDTDERTPIVAMPLAQEMALHLSGRAAYASGYLFYARDRALLAQPFDATQLKFTGEPVRLADAVAQTSPGRSAFDVSANAVLVYRPPPTAANSQLTWFDRGGREIGQLANRDAYGGFSLSRDGRQVLADSAAIVGSGSRAIARIDVASGASTPVSTGGQRAVWSPDSSKFAYRGPQVPIVRISPSDGSEPAGRPLGAPNNSTPGDWSADGRVIVGTTLRAETSSYDIWAIRVDTREVTLPVASVDEDVDPRLSPDGQWLAYAVANPSRSWDVFVRSFERVGTVLRVGSGRYPHWTADGRNLLYVSADGTLMQAAVDLNNPARVTANTTLFQHAALAEAFQSPFAPYPYDVSSDGARVLLRVPVEAPRPAPITVLLNWPSVLGR